MDRCAREWRTDRRGRQPVVGPWLDLASSRPVESETRDGANDILELPATTQHKPNLAHELIQLRVGYIGATPHGCDQFVAADRPVTPLDQRSEERRVGKE